MNEKTVLKYMEHIGISPWQVYPQDMSKFADLIIKDCANQIDAFVAMNVPPVMLSSLLKKQYTKDESSKEL